MAVHIAFLRGINVGGHNLVSMSELRAFMEALGFAGTKSLLQSGNLVFKGGRGSGPKLEAMLEAEAEKRLGMSITFLVRSAEEWETIIARNPFPREAANDPGHFLVMLLKHAPKSEAMSALENAIVGPEVVRADGRHLYLVYPAGVGTSKLTNTLIERKLGSPGTARNWNTVLKLAAMTRE
jgi:uncharacterized protein (DUF1697 family)